MAHTNNASRPGGRFTMIKHKYITNYSELNIKKMRSILIKRKIRVSLKKICFALIELIID